MSDAASLQSLQDNLTALWDGYHQREKAGEDTEEIQGRIIGTVREIDLIENVPAQAPVLVRCPSCGHHWEDEDPTTQEGDEDLCPDCELDAIRANSAN